MSWITRWAAARMVRRESWLAEQCRPHSRSHTSTSLASLYPVGHLLAKRPLGAVVMDDAEVPKPSLQTLLCSPLSLGCSQTGTAERQAGKGRSEAWRNSSQQRGESRPQRGLAPCSNLPAGAAPWGFHGWRGWQRTAQVGSCPMGMTQLMGIPHAAAHRTAPGTRGCGEKGRLQVWEGSLPRVDPGVAVVHVNSRELEMEHRYWRWDGGSRGAWTG